MEFQGQKLLKEGPGEGQFIAYVMNPPGLAIAPLKRSDVVLLCQVAWKLRTMQQINRVAWALREKIVLRYINEEKSGEGTSSMKA